ncbi:recombinase family protein [Micromonospora sp. CA-240977]|uniref:recombinase family protein n=1 Tax=Micromonospora sp. CA-240977 TaxID=3239957 RepID=UPI003D947CFD
MPVSSVSVVTCTPFGQVSDPHRSGRQWILTTVAAILANPRYTGRQVWNRQRTDRDALPDEGAFDRHHEIQRWSASTDWVISREIAHTPLVSEEHFVAIQAIHSAPTPADGIPRCNLLAGVICCGVCGRIMDSHWVHDRAGYRCRHGNTSTRPTSSRRQKTLYVREDHLLDRIRHDSCLRRHHPAMRDQDPDSVAGYLRLNNMIIVCDHDAWTIETDTAVFPLTAPTSVLTRTAKIPAQRDGDRSKREEKSRFVGK